MSKIGYQPTLPECSPAFLAGLKEMFDVRRMVRMPNVSVEYLRGVQEVLDAIESNNKDYYDEE